MPAPTFSLPAGWTADEVAGDGATSRDAFRSRRLETPRADYDLEFDKSREAADYVIRNLDRILRLPPDQDFLASIVADVKPSTEDADKVTLLADARIADLGGKGMSPQTRDVHARVSAYLLSAARELAERAPDRATRDPRARDRGPHRAARRRRDA